MNTLGHMHYIGEKDSPAHWSGPAQEYLESLTKLNGDLAKAINESPAPFREVLAAMHAEMLQLRRMVSENVILGMVRDEFWKQYKQVPIQVEDFVNISEATIALYDELFSQGILKLNPEVRAKINKAVAKRLEARKKVAA